MSISRLLFLAYLSIWINIGYAQKIESPQEFYKDTTFTKYRSSEEIHTYFEWLCKQSSQISSFEYGRTPEGHPLNIYLISNEGNMQDTLTIRRQHLNRIQGKTKDTGAPYPIWLSFGVHGDEASSAEAAMKLAHYLLTDTTSKTKSVLERLLILIDPNLNPDGRNRFVHYQRQFASESIAPLSQDVLFSNKHSDGRGNHYYFDLNRDWAWATQYETQVRLPHFHAWRPLMHIDLHEMYSYESYFFPPAASPIHPFIEKELLKEISLCGDTLAEIFTQKKWKYYRNEKFDLYYPSYGDSYTCLFGILGITLEQAGKGCPEVLLLEDGTYLTLRNRIEKHFTSCVTLLEWAAKRANHWIKLQNPTLEATFFSNKKSTAYLIRTNGNASRSKRLLKLLSIHGINSYEYPRIKGEHEVFDLNEKKDTIIQFLSTDAFVPITSNTQNFLHSLLQTRDLYSDSLTYDLTSWAVSYLYGVEVFEITHPFSTEKEYRLDQKLPILSSNNYGYLLSWESTDCFPLLSSIWENTFEVFRASEDFILEGISYTSGTFFIPSPENKEQQGKLQNLINEALVKNPFLSIKEVKTSNVDQGPDFGSNKWKKILAPKICLLTQTAYPETAFGDLWFFFDKKIKIPYIRVQEHQLNSALLKGYNTLIIGTNSIQNWHYIRQFASDGGTVIFPGIGVKGYYESHQSSFSSIEKHHLPSIDEPKDAINKEAVDRHKLSYTESSAFYKLNGNKNHPLWWGTYGFYYSLLQSTFSLHSGEPHLGIEELAETNPFSWRMGFRGSYLKEMYFHSLRICSERFNRGKMIFFLDNPLFRGMSPQAEFIFMNAVLWEK